MPFPLIRVLDPFTEPVSLDAMKNYLRVDIDDDDVLIGNLISVARERAEDLTSRGLQSQQFSFSMDRFPGWYGENLANYGWDFHRHHEHDNMFIHDKVAIILPRGPVLSVDSIQYKDQTGMLQTLASNQYTVDLQSCPARINPAYGLVWPVALWDTNSVTILFTCGHEQTVTEIVTLGTAAPFSSVLKRQVSAISLTSAIDTTTNLPVVANLANGVVQFPNGTANQTAQVVYQISSIPKSIIHAIYLMVGAWYENRAEVVQGGGNFNSLPTPMSASSLLSTYKLFQVGYPRS